MVYTLTRCSFGLQSNSFVAYEEFCSKYDLLRQDLSMLRRSISNWETFEQAIEALSKSVVPINTRRMEGNMSMTLNDLLIKVFFFFFLSVNDFDFSYKTNVSLAHPTSMQISAPASRSSQVHCCQ